MYDVTTFINMSLGTIIRTGTPEDLISEYVRVCYNVYASGQQPVDYWNNTNAELLNRFNKVGGNEALKGDIVVLYPNHIGIATGNMNSGSLEIVEQSLQAVSTRHIDRMSVAGLLRPMSMPQAAVEVIPAYEPATPVTETIEEPAPLPRAIPQGAYTVPSGKFQETDYNLRGYSTAPQAAALEQKYLTTVPAGEYMVYNIHPQNDQVVNLKSEDGRVWAWVNLKEQQLIQAQQESDTAQLAAEAAAADQAKKAAQALAAQAKAAEIRKNWETTQPTTTPTVSAVQPSTDWRDTFKPFRNNHGEVAPINYVALHDLSVVDLERKRTNQTWLEDHSTPISGVVIGADKKSYMVPKAFYDKGLFFGVEEFDHNNRRNLISAYDLRINKSLEERQETHTLTWQDYLVQYRHELERLSQKVMDVIKPKKQK